LIFVWVLGATPSSACLAPSFPKRPRRDFRATAGVFVFKPRLVDPAVTDRRGTEAPRPTLGSPLASPAAAGCHVPVDRRQRMGRRRAIAIQSLCSRARRGTNLVEESRFSAKPPKPDRKKTFPPRLAVSALCPAASGPFFGLAWRSALASPRAKRNGPRVWGRSSLPDLCRGPAPSQNAQPGPPFLHCGLI
jgi:hypothetical protein